jgi:hypothetical protein
VVVRRPLTPPELYERLNRMFVVLERSGFDGQPLTAAGGVSITSGQVYTSVSSLDGALTLTVILPDGSRRVMPAVLAWNRHRDWAVLGETAHSAAAIGQVPAAVDAKVGDRLFTVESSISGGRVLRE